MTPPEKFFGTPLFQSMFYFNDYGWLIFAQGRLEMWLELLTPGECHLPPPVALAPRQPQEFELRVIVWNTRDVILQEKDIFLGERVSDIYIKGLVENINNIIIIGATVIFKWFLHSLMILDIQRRVIRFIGYAI